MKMFQCYRSTPGCLSPRHRGALCFGGNTVKKSVTQQQRIIPQKTTKELNNPLFFHSPSHNLQLRCQVHNQPESSLFGTELKVIEMSDGIIKLLFNRPHKANAMGKKMLSELQAIVKMLNSSDSKVRCVILTSCNEKVFSAGADLKERSSMTMEEASAFVTSLRSSLDALASLPMPMIACVEVREVFYFSIHTKQITIFPMKLFCFK